MNGENPCIILSLSAVYSFSDASFYIEFYKLREVTQYFICTYDAFKKLVTHSLKKFYNLKHEKHTKHTVKQNFEESSNTHKQNITPIKFVRTFNHQENKSQNIQTKKKTNNLYDFTSAIYLQDFCIPIQTKHTER